ncbi:hypothetical protein Tco_0182970, partial [Tanacetum coccineum]
MEMNLIERLPFLKDVFFSIDHPLSAKALTILLETPTEPSDLVGAVLKDVIPEPGSEGKVGGSTRGDANVGDFVF